MKSTAKVEWCSTTHKQFKQCTKNGTNGDKYCGEFFPTGQCHSVSSYPGLYPGEKGKMSVCVPKECGIDNSELIEENYKKLKVTLKSNFFKHNCGD